jgi:hypothetical protein
MIIFSSVWFDFYKKITKSKFFVFKKTRNRFKLTGFSSVFRKKTGLTWFFSSLAQFFSVWVRFSFFGFRLTKPKPNKTGRFFQNFNRFFSRFGFFSYFFLFNWFFSFFAHL